MVSFHSPGLPGARCLLDAETLANRIVDVLADGQAEDIALIDVAKVSSITDYFVIASVASPLQFNALVERLGKALREESIQPRARNGAPQSGWVLLDYQDVIVHLFTPEKRAFYRLEELWGKTGPVVRFTG
jgi:ribosome-associated protein